MGIGIYQKQGSTHFIKLALRPIDLDNCTKCCGLSWVIVWFTKSILPSPFWIKAWANMRQPKQSDFPSFPYHKKTEEEKVEINPFFSLYFSLLHLILTSPLFICCLDHRKGSLINLSFLFAFSVLIFWKHFFSSLRVLFFNFFFFWGGGEGRKKLSSNASKFLIQSCAFAEFKEPIMKLDTSGLESAAPVWGAPSELVDGFSVAPSFELPNATDVS